MKSPIKLAQQRKEKAIQLFKDSNGNKPIKEIALEVGVSEWQCGNYISQWMKTNFKQLN